MLKSFPKPFNTSAGRKFPSTFTFAERIPPRDNKHRGIIVLLVKNQWDNFVPKPNIYYYRRHPWPKKKLSRRPAPLGGNNSYEHGRARILRGWGGARIQNPSQGQALIYIYRHIHFPEELLSHQCGIFRCGPPSKNEALRHVL